MVRSGNSASFSRSRSHINYANEARDRYGASDWSVCGIPPRFRFAPSHTRVSGLQWQNEVFHIDLHSGVLRCIITALPCSGRTEYFTYSCIVEYSIVSSQGRANADRSTDPIDLLAKSDLIAITKLLVAALSNRIPVVYSTIYIAVFCGIMGRVSKKRASQLQKARASRPMRASSPKSKRASQLKGKAMDGELIGKPCDVSPS